MQMCWWCWWHNYEEMSNMFAIIRIMSTWVTFSIILLFVLTLRNVNRKAVNMNTIMWLGCKGGFHIIIFMCNTTAVSNEVLSFLEWNFWLCKKTLQRQVCSWSLRSNARAQAREMNCVYILCSNVRAPVAQWLEYLTGIQKTQFKTFELDSNFFSS